MRKFLRSTTALLAIIAAGVLLAAMFATSMALADSDSDDDSDSDGSNRLTLLSSQPFKLATRVRIPLGMRLHWRSQRALGRGGPLWRASVDAEHDSICTCPLFHLFHLSPDRFEAMRGEPAYAQPSI